MNDTTATTPVNTLTTLDGQDYTIQYLGEGNWEAITPAGDFEIVCTGDGQPTAEDTIAVFGPNHHYEDAWFDTFGEVLAYLARNGSDARTTRHLVPQA
jgi:hypothetical protein